MAGFFRSWRIAPRCPRRSSRERGGSVNKAVEYDSVLAWVEIGHQVALPIFVEAARAGGKKVAIDQSGRLRIGRRHDVGSAGPL